MNCSGEVIYIWETLAFANINTHQYISFDDSIKFDNFPFNSINISRWFIIVLIPDCNCCPVLRIPGGLCDYLYTDCAMYSTGIHTGSSYWTVDSQCVG